MAAVVQVAKDRIADGMHALDLHHADSASDVTVRWACFREPAVLYRLSFLSESFRLAEIGRNTYQ